MLAKLPIEDRAQLENLETEFIFLQKSRIIHKLFFLATLMNNAEGNNIVRIVLHF